MITLNEIIDLIPKTTSLVYVDYRDNLDEQQDIIQKCIHNNNFDDLYEKIDEWYWDCDNITYYIDKLKTDLENKYNLTEEEVENLIEKYEDEIRDTIYGRCDDDTVKDLINNTSDLVAHYDTRYYVNEGSWDWTKEEVKNERIKLKKFLQIKSTKYDKNIDMMIRQSSGGGYLLIYFNMDINDFIDNNAKSIKFKNANIGIINHYEGSGDITYLEGHNFSLPYNPKNVFLEETIKYNWTYSIAGMSYDWCESTKYEFSIEDLGKIDDSYTNNLLEKEENYNKVYTSGKCSAGDMDINRHRDLFYRNDFPCGTKCPHCGTFFID